MHTISGRSFPSFPSLLTLCTVIGTITAERSYEDHVDGKPHSSIVGMENSPISTVVSVAGGPVLLPCDAMPTNPADSVDLVIVYRAESGNAIYSMDARKTTFYKGTQWSDEDEFGTRAFFETRPGHQGLMVNPLIKLDEGLYRCRVDFRASSTRNFLIKLKVVEPPQHMLITSSLDGGRIVSGNIGPYLAGDDLTLTCQVSGGTPRPSVVWWEAEALLDDRVEETSLLITRNSITISRLTAADMFRRFQCIAINNEMTAPLSSKVSLNIAVPPASLDITVRERVTSTGKSSSLTSETVPVSINALGKANVKVHREYEMICESTGSRPKASLLWLINGAPMEELNRIKGEHNAENPRNRLSPIMPTELDTFSNKSFRFAPGIEDDGKLFTCRAFNSILNSSIMEKSIRLKVNYPPQVKIIYDSKIARDSLEEGDSFAFDCIVSASPAEYSVQWLRNGVPILSGVSEDTVVRGPRLDVSRASRHLSGSYNCAAANSEGANTSNPLNINIKFTPLCNGNQPRLYRATIGDEVLVTCSVHSHQPPSSFRWALNSSAGIVDLPQSSYSSLDNMSTLRYMPRTELDFGSVLCWAANDVGLMRRPCVIHILPEGKPDSVTSCRIETNPNFPPTVIDVECVRGWDGGLNQSFILEVRKLHDNNLVDLKRSRSSFKPIFNVKHLVMGEEYLLSITATNARSSSIPVTLSYTPRLSEAAPLMNSEDFLLKETWFFILLLIAMIMTAIVMLLIVYLVIKSKYFTAENKDMTSPIQLSNSNSSFYDQSCYEKEDERSLSIAGFHQTSVDSCTKPPILGDFHSQDDCLSDHQDSGCDTTRNSTPCYFDPDIRPSSDGSSFRHSGPYHNSGLSPPPTPIPTTPLFHPVRQHLLPHPTTLATHTTYTTLPTHTTLSPCATIDTLTTSPTRLASSYSWSSTTGRSLPASSRRQLSEHSEVTDQTLPLLMQGYRESSL